MSEDILPALLNVDIVSISDDQSLYQKFFLNRGQSVINHLSQLFKTDLLLCLHTESRHSQKESGEYESHASHQFPVFLLYLTAQ